MAKIMSDDKGWGNKWPSSVTITWPKQAAVNSSRLKSQGSNLVDTESYLYFQCDGCQAILDPHTKSFKTLQDKRAEAGWALKWNIDGMGYKVYCAECGEKVQNG